MGRDLMFSPGGKGANQAHAAHLDGSSVQLVGGLGADDFTVRALRGLQRAGVKLAAIRSLVDTSTGTALIQVTDDGEIAIALAPGAKDKVRPQQLNTPIEAAAWASHDLLPQCELPPETKMRAGAKARAAGSRVTLNLAPARELARHLAHGVVVTRGAGGAVAFPRPGGSAERTPFMDGLPPEGLAIASHPVAVVDSTGAGDTFCGVFAASLAAGRPLARALRRANAAAAWACTRRGAQVGQPVSQDSDALLAYGPPKPAVPTGAHRPAAHPFEPAAHDLPH